MLRRTKEKEIGKASSKYSLNSGYNYHILHYHQLSGTAQIVKYCKNYCLIIRGLTIFITIFPSFFSSELFLSSSIFSIAPQSRTNFITDTLEQFLHKGVQWNHKGTLKNKKTLRFQDYPPFPPHPQFTDADLLGKPWYLYFLKFAMWQWCSRPSHSLPLGTTTFKLLN